MKKIKKNDDISLLGRIIFFFKSIKNKIDKAELPKRFINQQKELANCNGEGSSCAARLSFGFNITKIIFTVLFCLFTVSALIFGNRILSYENVYYMFKDINYITDYNESLPSTLSYSEPFTNQNFAAFKNGLAVVSDREYKFFTSTGRTTLMLGSDYTNPKILTSNSTALIYDAGKSRYSIYNSFIELHSDELEYPISIADIADDGSYVLVTRSKNYATSAKLYNSQFELVTEYSKNDYIISAKMTPDGKYTVIMSLDSLDGDEKMSISILKKGEQKLHSQFEAVGSMPYSCEIISDNRIVVFYQNKFVIYSFDGTVKTEYRYPTQLTYISFAGDSFILVFKDNNVNSSILMMFDKNGTLSHFERLEKSIYSIAKADKYVYVLCEKEILRIDTMWGSIKSIPFVSESGELLALPNGEILLCTPISAYRLDFD